MPRRVLAILETQLRAHLGGQLIPFAALLALGALMAALCLLVRTDLSPFGYALFTLFSSAGLVAMTLLGEYGTILRADPAAAWAESLPATELERRLGHGLAVLAVLAITTTGVLLPALLLAPGEMGWEQRAGLLVAGLGLSLALGAFLLAIQVVLGARGEGLLVVIQTVLVVGAVVGLLRAASLPPVIAEIESGARAWPAILSWMPPAWYAGMVAERPMSATLPSTPLVLLATLAALALLFGLPRAPQERARSTKTLLTRALTPFRFLARRFWVSSAERGPFELVYDALPLEREFVLRTYPMIGLPLAFLVAGTRGAGGDKIEDLLALLLFTPAIYLPILLAQVPATASHGARWMLDTAPIPPGAIRGGTIKALAVRFLLPLYVALTALSWSLAGPAFALRLAIPGALFTFYCLRILYPRCVLDLPLSTDPETIEVKHDWTGLLITLAAFLTLFALLARRFVTDAPRALILIAVMVAVEVVVDRAQRRPRSGIAVTNENES